jgi:hypothetical protein
MELDLTNPVYVPSNKGLAPSEPELAALQSSQFEMGAAPPTGWVWIQSGSSRGRFPLFKAQGVNL